MARGKSYKSNASKLMRGCNGYQDPTCYQAMKTCFCQKDDRPVYSDDDEKASIEMIANSNNARRMTLQIDRKHKEYSIVTYDRNGHATYIGRTYEDESEIPQIVLRKDGKPIGTT